MKWFRLSRKLLLCVAIGGLLVTGLSAEEADSSAEKADRVRKLLALLPNDIDVVAYCDGEMIRRSEFASIVPGADELIVFDNVVAGVPHDAEKGMDVRDLVVAFDQADGSSIAAHSQHLRDATIDGTAIYKFSPETPLYYRILANAFGGDKLLIESVYFAEVEHSIVMSPAKATLLKCINRDKARSLSDDVTAFATDVVNRYALALRGFPTAHLKSTFSDFDSAAYEHVMLTVAVDDGFDVALSLKELTSRDAVQSLKVAEMFRKKNIEAARLFMGATRPVFIEPAERLEATRDGRTVSLRMRIPNYLAKALTDLAECVYLDGNGKFIKRRADATWILIRHWDGGSREGYTLFLDKDGRLKNGPDGFAKATFFSEGVERRLSFQDAAGKQTSSKNGYASASWDYRCDPFYYVFRDTKGAVVNVEMVVNNIAKGSYGASVGLQAGDIIIDDDIEVNRAYSPLVGRLRGSELQDIVILRGLDRLTIKAVPEKLEMDVGFVAQHLLPIKRNVVIAEVEDDSAAQRLGVRPGDIFEAYGGQRVYRSSHARFTIESVDMARKGKTKAITLSRNGKLITLSMSPEEELGGIIWGDVVSVIGKPE